MELASADLHTLHSPVRALQLARNAWLLNLLTFVTLVIAMAFVALLRMQSDADMYVLIGVAGSAYLVLQVWTFMLCSRALQSGGAFLSPYLALLVSLLFFNTFLLSIHNSRALSIHPIREELQVTALPVLAPIFSLALLLTLPLARWITNRRAEATSNFRKRIHAAALCIFMLILTPIPLFVYLSQIVEMQDLPNNETSYFNSLWKAVLSVTPEPIANAGLWIVRDSRWHDGVLRSGRPSSSILISEAQPSLRPQAALAGLWQKDRDLAVQVSINLAQTSERPVIAWTQSVADILCKQLTDSELETVVKDPRILCEYREAILLERFPADKLTTLPQDQRDAAAEFLKRVVQTRSIELGANTIWIYSYTNSIESIKSDWSAWIQENNSRRARDYAQLISSIKAKYKAELILQCLNHGSAAMQNAVVTRIAHDRMRFSSADRNSILRAMLKIMEKRGEVWSTEGSVVRELTGIPNIPVRKGPIRILEYQAYFDRIRAFLDKRPDTTAPTAENSASQATVSE